MNVAMPAGSARCFRRRLPLLVLLAVLLHLAVGLLFFALDAPVSRKAETVERLVEAQLIQLAPPAPAPAPPVARPVAPVAAPPKRVDTPPPAPAPLPAPAPAPAPVPAPASTPAPAVQAAAPPPVQAATPAAAAPSAPATPKTVAPGQIRCQVPQPAYSNLSKRMGEEGRVNVRLLIDESGQVARAELTGSSSYDRLDRAALDAARRARCEPYLDNGRPIRILVTQPFVFKLEQN